MDDDTRLQEVTRRLLLPYVIPDNCPYLSEDQRELSLLPVQKRSEWMAEWLLLAQNAEPPD